MPKRAVSNLKKMELVLYGIQNNVVVTRFCKEHGIARSTFYRWRKLVLAGLAAFIFGDKKAQMSKKEEEGGDKQKVKRYRCRRK